MAASAYPTEHFRVARGQGHVEVASFRGFPSNLAPPQRDGLATLSIRSHTLEKLQAAARFCNAFSTALKKTAPTTYIDLFAGPGVLELETSHELVWGSPLLALQCPEPFKVLAFVERDTARWEALRERAKRVACRGETLISINGPAENVLDDLLPFVPRDSIAVTVVDPFRIEFSMAAVRKLARGLPRLDLILLFAEGMDLQRNMELAFRDPAHAARYDAVFDGPGWRNLVKLGEPPGRNAGRVRGALEK